jgi:hypothetical protein
MLALVFLRLNVSLAAVKTLTPSAREASARASPCSFGTSAV